MQIAVSVASHIQDLPELTDSVRYEVVENATREALTAKWQEWIQAAGIVSANNPFQSFAVHHQGLMLPAALLISNYH